jgi:hypothetical protein
MCLAWTSAIGTPYLIGCFACISVLFGIFFYNLSHHQKILHTVESSLRALYLDEELDKAVNGGLLPESIADHLKSLSTQRVTNARLKSGLDSTLSAVMVADEHNVINYCNEAMINVFRSVEKDMQRVFPSFRADALIGVNMDTFHKNPQHQKNMVSGLTKTFKGLS